MPIQKMNETTRLCIKLSQSQAYKKLSEALEDDRLLEKEGPLTVAHESALVIGKELSSVLKSELNDVPEEVITTIGIHLPAYGPWLYAPVE